MYIYIYIGERDRGKGRERRGETDRVFEKERGRENAILIISCVRVKSKLYIYILGLDDVEVDDVEVDDSDHGMCMFTYEYMYNKPPDKPLNKIIQADPCRTLDKIPTRPQTSIS